MICPICAVNIPTGAAVCPGCGTDLSDYLTAAYQPDLLFNEALDHIRYQRYSEASELLCRAWDMRPGDTELLKLRIRCEYLSGNKRRALELMTVLLEQEPTEENMSRLSELSEEYDFEQSSADMALKQVLKKEGDRLTALIDRMEASLSSASARPAADASQAPAAKQSRPAPVLGDGMPDFASFSDMFPPSDIK